MIERQEGIGSKREIEIGEKDESKSLFPGLYVRKFCGKSEMDVLEGRQEPESVGELREAPKIDIECLQMDMTMRIARHKPDLYGCKTCLMQEIVLKIVSCRV